MKINNFARKAYKAYTAFGLTPEGACGLMGNQYSESAGFLANRLEFLCVKRYKEKGKTYRCHIYAGGRQRKDLQSGVFEPDEQTLWLWIIPVDNFRSESRSI